MADYVFIWEDAPGNTHGFVPVVRAANGATVTNPAGYDYRSNYAAWVKAMGEALPAWDYLYPGTDGATAGKVLAAAAPHAPFYVIDVEDQGVTQAALEALIAQLPADRPVYLSTYGLMSQCDSRGIPYQARGLDGIWPQVYFSSQMAGIAQWRGKHYTAWPTFSPADCPTWTDDVDAGPCAMWRYGVLDLAAAAAALVTARAALTTGDPVSTTAPIDIDHYVDRVNALAAAGHLDGFFRRFLTIARDQYGGQSMVNNVAAIRDSTAKIAAEETAPGAAT